MLGFFRKKSAQIYTLDKLAELAGFVRYGSASGITVSPETAVQVPAVMCAIKVIAEGIAQMPVRLVAEEFDGDRVKRIVARDHWAHKLLSKQPNAFQTSFEFREYVITAAVLDKGFLGIKNTLADGKVTEILPIPIGSWSIERDTGSWEHFFRVSYANGTSGDFLPSQCVYLRGPSLDGWRALPALSAAREAIGLSVALEKQQARLAGNGGKPSGVLSFEETLSPERRDKLRELWQERFGPNGEGGVAVLDGSAKFMSMTMTSVDAQTLESRRHQVNEVARAFRVHPNKLMGAGDTSTYASAESFARVHVVDTLGPWMKRFEEVFDRDILENDMGLRVDLDERGLLRGEFKDQAEFLSKMMGSGGHQQIMSLNEARNELGLNAVDQEWADTIAQSAMAGPQTALEGQQNAD